MDQATRSFKLKKKSHVDVANGASVLPWAPINASAASSNMFKRMFLNKRSKSTSLLKAAAESVTSSPNCGSTCDGGGDIGRVKLVHLSELFREPSLAKVNAWQTVAVKGARDEGGPVVSVSLSKLKREDQSQDDDFYFVRIHG